MCLGTEKKLSSITITLGFNSPKKKTEDEHTLCLSSKTRANLVNLILKGQRSMATDSLFILLLPGRGSRPKDAYDEVNNEGEVVPLVASNSNPGTLRHFLKIFYYFIWV